MGELILLEKADRVATITLNRPEVMNAFNAAMLDELDAALRESERDRNFHLIVIKDAGRAFVRWCGH